jgi:hypothetical protein
MLLGRLGGDAGLAVVTSASDLPQRRAINLVASVVLTLPGVDRSRSRALRGASVGCVVVAM